jgi:hypothetical protein
MEETIKRLDHRKKDLSGFEARISMTKTSLVTKTKEFEGKIQVLRECNFNIFL